MMTSDKDGDSLNNVIYLDQYRSRDPKLARLAMEVILTMIGAIAEEAKAPSCGESRPQKLTGS